MIGAGGPNGYGGVTTSTRTLAEVGGEEDHQLSDAEMPSHDHGSAGNHRHQPNDTSRDFVVHGSGGAVEYAITGGALKGNNSYTAYSGTHTHSTNGSDTAHNTMQPFGVIKWIIKY